ncbi:hypothetical protein DRQ32_08315, partial [bacterium]
WWWGSFHILLFFNHRFLFYSLIHKLLLFLFENLLFRNLFDYRRRWWWWWWWWLSRSRWLNLNILIHLHCIIRNIYCRFVLSPTHSQQYHSK